MSRLLLELRYAFRSWLRSPGLALVAVLTLALGIGANTAIFSVVHAVLLDPLPFVDPNRLVAIWRSDLDSGTRRDDLAYPNVADLAAWSRSLDQVAAISNGSPQFSWSTGSGTVRLRGLAVSDNYFRLLGQEPAMGRDFRQEDDRPGAARVALLSHGSWMEDFGGDPGVVGKSLSIDGASFTVIGVLRAQYRYPEGIDLYTPIEPWLAEQVDNRKVSLAKGLGRLGPERSWEQAQAEVGALAARLREGFPDANRNQDLFLESLPELILGDVRPALLVLLGSVGLVLFIACANVANLLLVRSASRREELATRIALGAGRRRLLAQHLAESLVLAVAGGIAGLAIAGVGVAGLERLLPADLPRSEAIAVDLPILAFTCGISLLAALAFGLLPAWRASTLDPVGGWSESSRRVAGSVAGDRLQRALVVGQMAIGLAVVITAGLLIETFRHLQDVDAGFSREGVLMYAVVLPEHEYPDKRARDDFFDRYSQRLSQLPGVEASGAFLLRPLHGEVGFDIAATIEGQGREEFDANPLFNYQSITPGYFDAMGIPLVAGRTFLENEGRAEGRSVIVDQATAGRFWPGEDPLGKRLKLHGPEATGFPWMTVVGVTADVASNRWTSTSYDLYEPFPRNRFAPWTRHMQFALRTTGDPGALVAAARRLLRELDPARDLDDVQTTADLVGGELAQPRFNMLLMGFFGVLGLGLSALGLYGVMAYTVADRTREIGIRLALGETPAGATKWLLGQGLVLLAGGSLLGFGLAWAGARLAAARFGKLLYGVGWADPSTYALALAVLSIAAGVACYLPCRRAAGVDPATALRHE